MTEPVMTDKDLACSDKRPPGDMKIYIHSAVGILLMVIFQFIPAGGGITPIGMKVLGAFLGMVYLWSLVDTLWPSLLGLLVIGLSGFAGEGIQGMRATMMTAFGQDTVLITIFAMILFGTLYEVGATHYIANWFLTRKAISGRPYVFLTIFYMGCFVLSALISPIASLIMLWPITLAIMATIGVERCDNFWPYFFVGMFLVSTLGQPFFPFLGAQLIVVSAFQQMSGMTVPYLPYMAFNAIMTFLIMATYILVIKFIIRPDVSKVKAVDADVIRTQNQLPAMDVRQKLMLILLPIYITLLLLPSFLPKTLPVIKTLDSLGTLGITMTCCVVFCILRYAGGPILNFKEVAYHQFNWGIYFMIAAAVYAANALSNDVTGIKVFLLETLDPMLGGRSEFVFIGLMFVFALLLTNFANNAAMAVVLMPVIIAFCAQMGINPMPVAMGVSMMVFVAMLTPSASPHAGMMWGRKDIYTTGDILKIGLPCCILSLVYYIVIGYPLAKILFM